MNQAYGLDLRPTAVSLYSSPCNFLSYMNMPHLEIQLNDFVYELPKESLIHYSAGSCYLLAVPRDFGVTYEWKLVGAEYRQVAKPLYWILGNAFMHHYYSIFDLEKQRVGLVPSDLGNGAVGRGLPPESGASMLPVVLLAAISVALLAKQCRRWRRRDSNPNREILLGEEDRQIQNDE